MSVGGSMDAADTADPTWRPRWWHQEIFRNLLAWPAALIGGLLVPGDFVLTALVGWDCYAVVLLVLTWHALWGRTPGQLRQLAEWSHRRRRWSERLGVTPQEITQSATLMAMASTLWVLPRADGYDIPEATVVVLCLVGVVTSWVLAHVAYLSIYLSEYVRDGGLQFPGVEEPDAVDFAYFAFGVGTSFGTTDVTVTSRRIRRQLLAHGILAFVLNTAIVTIAVTFVTSYLSEQ